MGLYPSYRLENTETREKLIKLGHKKELVDDIIDQFWFRDWHNSLISYKPYFELFTDIYLVKI